MQDHVILRVITKVLVPFIILYGLYIQFHGELSPGGGFQAGVICAAAFIAYALTNGLDRSLKILPFKFVVRLAACGVLIYGLTGVVALIKGGNFLGYSHLIEDDVFGQQLGIMTIELGVGITVFSVVMIIFYAFSDKT